MKSWVAALLAAAAALAAPAEARAHAFAGDALGQPGARMRDKYFTDCRPLPRDADALLAADLAQDGAAACAALVVLLCGQDRLTGFHLIRWSDRPLAFRLYTAAHSVNFYNRELSPPGAAAVYPFEECTLALARGGPALEDVAIGPVRFRDAATRSAAATKSVLDFASEVALSANDLAWFDIAVPGGSKSRLVLEKIALSPYRGEIAPLAVEAQICAAGAYGPGGAPVQRCADHGLWINPQGGCMTRTPIVNGMSGGVFTSRVEGRDVAVCMITGEWNLQLERVRGPIIPGIRGSRVIPFRPGRENRGLRY